MISAVILDTPSSSEHSLWSKLCSVDDFNICANCAEPKDAIKVLNSCSVDVVFIDIEHAKREGERVVQFANSALAIQPLIVFVTGMRDFAAKAFDYQAFDYLLKPYTEERFRHCITRVKEALQQRIAATERKELNELLKRKTGQSINGFMHKLQTKQHTNFNELSEIMSLKCGAEWHRVKVDDITWIEAAGDYVCVHALSEVHIVRSTLKRIHVDLCQKRFVRFNRSSIVNTTKIKTLIPNSNGEYVATLINGATIKVSRKYKLLLNEFSQQPLSTM